MAWAKKPVPRGKPPALSPQSVFSMEFPKLIEEAYRRFLGEELHAILRQQIPLHGGSGYLVGNEGFYYGSKGPIVLSVQYVPAHSHPAPLDPTLHEAHAAWRASYDRHAQDFPRIQQVLTTCLLRARDTQDLRDMLPEHVVRIGLQHPAISGLTRSRPSLYAGAPPPAQTEAEYQLACAQRDQCWDSRLIQLYEPVGPLIDQYLGFRFL